MILIGECLCFAWCVSIGITRQHLMISCHNYNAHRTPGGESLVDALAIYDMKEPFWEYFKEPPYKIYDTWNKGKWNYIAFSPLLSYIINATSGLMPSQYLEKYFMPYLGPGPETPSGEHTMTPWADEIWGWKKIDDGMEYGWSGMSTSILPLLRIYAYLIYIPSHTRPLCFLYFLRRYNSPGFGKVWSTYSSRGVEWKWDSDFTQALD